MSEMRRINPPELGDAIGYSNGMLSPPGARTLFVAGQTARDESGVIADGGMIAQWGRALDNVITVVRSAGGAPTDIVRMTVFATDRDAYLKGRRELGPVWRERMGRHFPAMSVVFVSSLVDDGAMVEIEATAVIP